MIKFYKYFIKTFNFAKIQRKAQIGLSDFEQKHKTKAKILS